MPQPQPSKQPVKSTRGGSRKTDDDKPVIHPAVTFTVDQRKFIDLFVQYVAHEKMSRGDAAMKAAEDVGYKTPKTTAQRFLAGGPAYFHIRDEIHRQLALCEAAREAEHEISAERIIKELGRVAFHNPKSMLDNNGYVKDVADMDDATAASMQVTGVREVVVINSDGSRKMVRKLEVKPYNKLRALDQLALCLGLQSGKGANSMKNQQTINVQWAEIFGPAAAPPSGSGNSLDNPDELEKRIQAEEAQAKALPPHLSGVDESDEGSSGKGNSKGKNPSSYRNGVNGSNGRGREMDQSDEDEYV